MRESDLFWSTYMVSIPESLKASFGMISVPLGIFIFLSEVQPPNALDNMFVTPSGMVMLASELQF